MFYGLESEKSYVTATGRSLSLADVAVDQDQDIKDHQSKSTDTTLLCNLVEKYIQEWPCGDIIPDGNSEQVERLISRIRTPV